MSEWLVVIAGFFKWLFLLFLWAREKDKINKQLKKEAADYLKQGLKEKNASTITAAWDRARRL